MTFSLKDALHKRGLTQRQQLLIVLKSEGGKPLSVARIKEVAVAAGLGRVRTWDIGSILRRATGLAIRTPDGWELTKEGHRAAASLADGPPESIGRRAKRRSESVSMEAPVRSANLVLVTALPAELESAKEAFARQDAWVTLPRDGESYDAWLAPLTTKHGGVISVVAVVASGMGLTAAAIRATQAIARFSPNVVVMIGIAAGTRANGRNYGDPLIADPCVDYTSGKVEPKKGRIVFRPDPYPLPLDPHVQSTLRGVASNGEFLDEISRSWRAPRPPHQLNAHVGPLGTGDQVVDANGTVDEAQKHWRKLIGLEMEVYAVYRAARESRAPQPAFFCVKSVCDFAEQKKDTWQAYARYVSSEYARAIVHSYWTDLTPRK